MGFIERLRQEKDARERAAADVEQSERERRERVSRERQQRDLAEKQLHEARRSQAEQTLRESGIEELLDELASLIDDRSSVFLYGQSRDLQERGIYPRDQDSYSSIVEWDIKSRPFVIGKGKNWSEKYFVTEACPDGTIIIHQSIISSGQWRNNKAILESALERAYRNPMIYKWTEKGGNGGYSGGDNRGPCLPGNTLISTPSGLFLIKKLKVGDRVWTIDEIGNKIATVVIRTSRTPVKSNHKMLHVVLSDGRELFVSPGHPDASGNPLRWLVKGEYLDGALVISANIITYREKCTYDILPAGPTGNYWASGVLIGSTLVSSYLLNRYTPMLKIAVPTLF